MSWHAKPSGGYAIQSVEGTDNIMAVNSLLRSAGYSQAARAGVLANCNNESALNPWRWQADSVSQGGGYGLFQFTPASQYFNDCAGLPYYAPNTSVAQQTAGALPTDGICQVNVLIDDYLNKWVDTCWRSYWSDTALRAKSMQILTDWGSGSTISQNQFKAITDIEDALFCFFACYEGPANELDYYGRINDAYTIYNMIGGGPTPIHHGKLPIWMMCKPYWKR